MWLKSRCGLFFVALQSWEHSASKRSFMADSFGSEPGCCDTSVINDEWKHSVCRILWSIFCGSGGDCRKLLNIYLSDTHAYSKAIYGRSVMCGSDPQHHSMLTGKGICRDIQRNIPNWPTGREPPITDAIQQESRDRSYAVKTRRDFLARSSSQSTRCVGIVISKYMYNYCR